MSPKRPLRDDPAPAIKKARPDHSRSLFVRGLSPVVTAETLTTFFSEHFPVKHATVVCDPATKASRGYGFVTFTDAEDAIQAQARLSGQRLAGRQIELDSAEPRQRTDKVVVSTTSAAAVRRQQERALAKRPPRLIVRNLPWSIDSKDQLERLFQPFGKVRFADLPKKGSKLAGFGFVTIRGQKNAEKALAALNGKELDGRQLQVDWALEKAEYEMQQQSKASSRSPATTGATGEQSGGDSDADESDHDGHDDSDNDVGVHDGSDHVDDSERDSVSQDSGVAKEAAGPDYDADQDLDRFMKDFMDRLEDEDEDDSDDDGEDGSDTEPNTKPPPKVLMTDTSSTLFLRNLNFATTEEALKSHFRQFGPVRYARLVMDKATDRPAGTGFVCFVHEADAKACLRAAPRSASAKPADNNKSRAQSRSVLQDDSLDPDGRYTLGGRLLQVSQAVSHEQAAGLGTPTAARKLDKRRLFLLSEGTIPKSSPLYSQLPQSEVKLREASEAQRRRLVKSNPTLHVSLRRLAVRNLPRSVDSAQLKALARAAVVGFAQDVKAGHRQPLSKAEIARGGDDDRSGEHERRIKRRGVVRQAKVVYETARGTKLQLDKDAKAPAGGRSRGYGFIEYSSHRWALMGLRWLNGQAIGEEGEKRQRPVVEFALENAQVVQRRRASERKAKEADVCWKMGTKDSSGLASGGGGKVEQSAGQDDGDGRAKLSAVTQSIIGRKRAMRKKRG